MRGGAVVHSFNPALRKQCQVISVSWASQDCYIVRPCHKTTTEAICQERGKQDKILSEDVRMSRAHRVRGVFLFYFNYLPFIKRTTTRPLYWHLLPLAATPEAWVRIWGCLKCPAYSPLYKYGLWQGGLLGKPLSQYTSLSRPQWGYFSNAQKLTHLEVPKVKTQLLWI